MLAFCMCPNVRCHQTVEIPDDEWREMIGRNYLVVKGCKPVPKDEMTSERGKWRWYRGKVIKPRPA